ncbi:FAD binding domain-containing protein [Nocardioides pyridinolyticus]
MNALLSAAELHRPSTVEEALGLLGSIDGSRPLAGATWLLRAPLRGDEAASAYVAIDAIPELGTVTVGDHEIMVGAAVTHAELATSLRDIPEVRVLRQAAAGSANPAVREMATVGGNLCTAEFPAADLVPALLALDGLVVLEGPDGSERVAVEQFLDRRSSLGSVLVTGVAVPRRPVRSAHARLTLRAAGDYPVAIVSVAVVLDGSGRIDEARVALGSVGQVPQRWPEVERELAGAVPESEEALAAARRNVDVLPARDGVEAPAWYRRDVVPALLAKALADAVH